ncbi:hypothetical protein SEA_ZOOMAN_154 [Microbacterium phage Zooman]|nr:hypothetical protein SEA_ZOOMAN_154 [Microbacterium phage Zooman]
MSRTDKDRPYWVKVRDEGVPTHDHSKLGEPIWRRRYQKDDEGNQVITRRPLYQKAKTIIDRWATPKQKQTWDYWSQQRAERSGYNDHGYYTWLADRDNFVARNPADVFADAFTAVELFDPEKRILVGTYDGAAFEMYIAGYVQDHCTVDEEEVKGKDWLNGQFPCYKTWDFYNSTFRCSCDMCNPGIDHSRIRTQKRINNTKLRKLANAGEDLDDYDMECFVPNRREMAHNW